MMSSPVVLPLDSDDEEELDMELLVDWRGRRSSVSYRSPGFVKRKNSDERATPAKKSEPDFVLLDTSPPRKSLSHVPPAASVSAQLASESVANKALDEVVSICLDSDNELDEGTKIGNSDRKEHENTDFSSFSSSHRIGNKNEDFANLPEVSDLTRSYFGNVKKDQAANTSEIMLDSMYTVHDHENVNVGPLDNVDADVNDPQIIAFEHLGTMADIRDSGTMNAGVQNSEEITSSAVEDQSMDLPISVDGVLISDKGTFIGNAEQDSVLHTSMNSYESSHGANKQEGTHEPGLEANLGKEKDGKLKHSNKETITMDREQERKRREDEKLQWKKERDELKMRRKEEQRLKKEQEKMQKAAAKAEAAELKKRQKEIEKWEKGKYALKAISAEIDTKVIEKGLIGGHLLSRLAEKEFSYHIVSTNVPSCILWKISSPDKDNLSFKEHEVPYIAIVLEASEFCDMVAEGSLYELIYSSQKCYPGYNICFIVNKLTSYMHKRDQEKYKNPNSASDWNHPPVEQALARLSTHFVGVRSRLCLDEAEVADHIVRLTRSLAECRFRRKLSHLSVNANGINILKDRGKETIRNNLWLKVLMAIPKLPPKGALAIAKKYPTMRSLLDVYLDPQKTVNEKEFLLQDLITEGPLGSSGRRLGPVCSKRIYRIFMAQTGCLKTDDVEDGADLFES